MFSIVLLSILLLGVLVLSAMLAWWLWFKYSNFCRMLNQLPGPDPLPIVGNSLEVLGSGVCENIIKMVHDKWPKMYGEVYRVYIASGPGAFVSSPELIESVVNNPSLLDKGKEYELLHSWLGLGLLTNSGAKWKSRRRLLTPAFHFHIMEDFFDTFNEQSLVLCRKIDNLCRVKSKAEINAESLTSLCTLDIICESAMGYRVDAQTKESEYVKAVHRISQLLAQRPMRIWNFIDAIYHMTAQGKDYLRCLKIVREFTDQVIKTKRQQFRSANKEESNDDDGIKKRRPFLDLLLEAANNGTDLSDEDISDEVNTFMFEGHDTTATAMNWFLHCMASNPQCQEKAYEELHNVFGDSDRPCTRQDLTELKYLECCIKETLRLYPSVPVFLRFSDSPVQIGEHLLPANCKVGVSTYALHRNPRIYPDPLTYNPDRFSPEQSKGRHPYAYIPFSAGPRNCIGQRFAMAEEKVVLSSLLRRFKLELSPTAPMPRPSMELTLKSATGVHLLVSRR